MTQEKMDAVIEFLKCARWVPPICFWQIRTEQGEVFETGSAIGLPASQ